MSVLERSDCTLRLKLQVHCFNWLLGIINNFLSIFASLFAFSKLGENEKQKAKLKSVFRCHAKTKNGNGTWIPFSRAIEKRLALRYTRWWEFRWSVFSRKEFFFANLLRQITVQDFFQYYTTWEIFFFSAGYFSPGISLQHIFSLEIGLQDDFFLKSPIPHFKL